MFIICLSHLLIILCWILFAKNHIIFLTISVSFLIIILMKNHDLFLAFDNHCQIAEHLINQSNQLSLQSWTCWLSSNVSLLYNCKHIDYFATSAQSTILSTSVIWQCQLIFSCSVSVNSNFSFTQFFFNSNFLAHFFVIFLFS